MCLSIVEPLPGGFDPKKVRYGYQVRRRLRGKLYPAVRGTAPLELGKWLDSNNPEEIDSESGLKYVPHWYVWKTLEAAKYQRRTPNHAHGVGGRRVVVRVAYRGVTNLGTQQWDWRCRKYHPVAVCKQVKIIRVLTPEELR